jgi:hypothetical protein
MSVLKQMVSKFKYRKRRIRSEEQEENKSIEKGKIRKAI